jgi:hypothetical protein
MKHTHTRISKFVHRTADAASVSVTFAFQTASELILYLHVNRGLIRLSL